MAIDDSYTKSLLHFNGANGSTTFTDESGKTWTRENTPTISTTQKKFGSASGLFVGANVDSIYTPDHADFNFGTDPFTIDFWIYITGTSTQHGVVNKGYYTLGKNANFEIDVDQTQLQFNSYDGRTNAEIVQITGLTGILNTWNHIAVVRSVNTITIYQGGISRGSGTVTKSIGDNDVALSVGYGLNTMLDGYIDELRISKGIARWTGNFTPHTTEYRTHQIMLW